MKIDSKKLKLLFLVFSILCVIAAAVCIICDFAMNKGFTWSAYPLSSIALAWLIVLPLLLVRKHRILLSLASLTVFIIPFLYSLELISDTGEWFLEMGVPSALIGLAALWITYLLIRFLKVSIWFMSAILVFLYGVLAAPAINYFAALYTGEDFISFSNIINVISCMAVSVLLFIIGFNKKTQLARESEKNT